MTPGALRVRGWLFLPTGMLLIGTLVVPVGLLIILSFWTNAVPRPVADWTVANYDTVITQPAYHVVLARTVVIAGITTAACILLAYPVAWWLAFRAGRSKLVWLVVLTLPFWTSYLLRIFSWRIILGYNGVINGSLMTLGLIEKPLDWLDYNDFSVIVALTHAWVTFAILPIFVTLERMDPALAQASRDLGYGPVRTFLRVTLPLSLPGVGAAGALIFIPVFGDYITPRLLGGPGSAMIGVLVYNTFSRGQNWPLAAALAALTVIWIVIAVGLVVTAVRLVRRGAVA